MPPKMNRKFKREHKWVVTFDVWSLRTPVRVVRKIKRTMTGLSRLEVWAAAKSEAAKYNRTHKTKMDVYGVSTKPVA